MTTSAPPRPLSARATPDTESLSRDEIEALVEALIEEARRETRRRHRRYWALAGLVAFVGVFVLVLLEGGAASQPASPALSARMNSAAQAGTTRIAFLTGALKPSPSGGYLQTELYVMNVDGSGKRPLVRHASSLGPEPFGHVWSPDGLKLAFGKRLGPAIGQCRVCHTEIFVIDADGSGQRNLTGNLGGDTPAWSPDGQTIAFSTTRENSFNPNLYVMNADGSGQRRVTQDAMHVWGSSWSPDGRRLAFVSCIPNPGTCDIYVSNVDGSSQQQLTNNPGPSQNPAWSPDGQSIAFQRIRMSSVPRDVSTELYLMNADGSGQRKLARMSNSDGLFSWSPDGRRIAFVSKRDGNDEVYVVDVDGSGLRNLTRNPARDGHPKWSSDGTKIGFVSNRGGNRDIYVMNADGSRQRNLTRDIDQQAFGIAWSPPQK
jgi:Tol biopolymer transport system component